MATPGWKTPKFWLTAIATIGATVLSAGLVPSAGAIGQIVGAGVAALGAVGYASVRSADKGVVPPAKSPLKTTEWWLATGTTGALLAQVAMGEGTQAAQYAAAAATMLGYLARHALPPAPRP